MTTPRLHCWPLAPGLVFALAGAQAAAQARDPFEPPPATRSASAAAAADPSRGEAPTVRHLLTVDGRRYALVGSRRYGVGEHLGEARIECIVDSGVIVREGSTLRKLPLYAGITKRPSPAAAGAGPARPEAAPALACPPKDR
jgi:hypothetical protein